MLPQFVLPETTVRAAGTGSEIHLGEEPNATLILTLGITRIIEQESLDLSVWGSADGSEWGAKPLASFPQKFYCGTYQILLDLSDHPGVKFLRELEGQSLGEGRSQALIYDVLVCPGYVPPDGRRGRVNQTDTPLVSLFSAGFQLQRNQIVIDARPMTRSVRLSGSVCTLPAASPPGSWPRSRAASAVACARMRLPSRRACLRRG